MVTVAHAGVAPRCDRGRSDGERSEHERDRQSAARAPAGETAPIAGEAALIARAVAGDGQAFAALYHAHADAVYRLLTRLVGPVADREDLLQNVFVRLHRALPGYRGDASLATLLYKVAVRVARDHLRSRTRRPVLVSGEGTDEAAADQPVAPKQAPPSSEVAAALEFLARLKPDQRIAFVLREVMDLSYPEIGELVGCRPATARMRVAAAARKLAALNERRRREP